jgi:REP element-mobilizing transposase RayT
MQSTARYRGWHLLAGAIMTNHLHLLVGVPGDPDPATLIRDLISYSSRVLNQKYGKPESGTWWTEGGSRRKLPDENAVQRAVLYVLNQKYALIASFGEQPNGEQQSGERPASAG